ncbi:MAG: ABC transporter substrate-binding protein, partial [Acidimicrobiales bacterium]
VGGGGVFDSTGQADRLACLLPDFPGYVVSAEARGSDFSVQATNGGSNTAVSFGLANYLDEKFPSAGDAVGYITANVNTTIINKQQYQEAGATLGWKTVYDDQYNAVGESTWLPFAQGIADKKVKGLYFVGSAVNLAKLLGSLAQIDYKLDWVAGPSNIYDPALVSEAGADLDVNNVYINDATTPFQATDVPAIPQYEGLFDTYLPNGLKTASLGLNSFAAWLLFAQSAKACGNDLTRLCVYDQAIHTTSFDGGGLSGQADPATPEVPTACFVPVVATSKGFTMIDWNANDGPYNCDPRNVIPLAGSYGSSVKFAAGQSLDSLK